MNTKIDCAANFVAIGCEMGSIPLARSALLSGRRSATEAAANRYEIYKTTVVE